jgi:hypothetical protein
MNGWFTYTRIVLRWMESAYSHMKSFPFGAPIQGDGQNWKSAAVAEVVPESVLPQERVIRID